MKITVIGASGLIGTKVVQLVTADGHQAVPASRESGVDVLTGEGLGEALAGADVLVDVVNSPSFEDDPVLHFFTTSTTNLVAAAKARRGLATTSRCRLSASTNCRTAVTYGPRSHKRS